MWTTTTVRYEITVLANSKGRNPGALLDFDSYENYFTCSPVSFALGTACCSFLLWRVDWST